MPDDGRHLRARWTLATIGWLLWLISLFLPVPSVAQTVWSIYPDALRELSRGGFQFRNIEQIVSRAALYGFLLASLVLIASPMLVHLNRSHDARTRRWRWLGIGLLAMAQLTVLLVYASRGSSAWPLHLLVLSHLIVCIAILPWPREQLSAPSAFEVILPTPSTADCADTADRKALDPRHPTSASSVET